MSEGENGPRPVALIDRDWEEQHMSPIENSDSAAWRELEAVRAEAAALEGNSPIRRIAHGNWTLASIR